MILLFSLVSADILSINSGGSNNFIINPNTYLEGFFFSTNVLPVLSNLILTSSSGTDTTNENLSISYDSIDDDEDAITNITDWRVEGNSIAVLNMPFDTRKVKGNVRDYSTYENNGTLGAGVTSNVPIWSSDCQVGGCYEFDGVNDYINIDDSSSLKGMSELTISFWINPFESQIAGIVDKNRGVEWNVHLTNNQVRFEGTNLGSSKIRFTSTSTLNSNQWTYVVVKYNNFVKKIYFNGVEQGVTINDDAVGDIFSSTNPVYVGKLHDGYYFNGSLDEVQIFDKVLSLEQIQTNYQAGLAGHHSEKLVSQETVMGETWQVAATPNDVFGDGLTVLSNELTIINAVPIDPTSVNLYSLNGRNESDTDLNCTGFISDADNNDSLTVEVNFSKNNVSQLIVNHTGINNGTTLGSILGNGNLTLGDIWKCSMKVYDLSDSSNAIDSNELEIIDITPPIIYVESPINNNNYTILNIFFNVSLNEPGSMCLYNLDLNGNVTMNQTNVTHFTYLDITLGPGDHGLWYYCSDTSSNWNSTYVNFSIENEAAISISMSEELSEGVLWDLLTLPADDLDAIGNNLNDSTDYYLNVSATNTLVDIYVRADGDLFNLALDNLGLANETYAISLNDSNVTAPSKVTMTTNYVLIAQNIATSMVYMKFYLDAPASQPAGVYKNNLQFKAVRNGQAV